MVRPLKLALAPWRSAKQTWADLHSDCGQDNDIARTINKYTKTIESNPSDARAYFARGTARHKASDYDIAIADLTKALNPCCAAVYAERGSAYYDEAQYDHAIADLNKAIEINPNSALPYCNLGWAYEAIGEDQKAVAFYRKALEIDPSLQAAKDNLKLLGVTS